MRTVWRKEGITLIEIVIGIALLAVIAGAGFLILNPSGQLGQARNQQRQLHLSALMNSIRQNIGESATGAFSCASGALPTSTRKMASGLGNYDIAPCLVPAYLTTMPFDPRASGARYVSVTDYDTGYYIVATTSTPAIVTLSAPSAELGKSITLTR